MIDRRMVVMDARERRQDGESCNELLRLKTVGKKWKVDSVTRRRRRRDVKSKKCSLLVVVCKCMTLDQLDLLNGP